MKKIVVIYISVLFLGPFSGYAHAQGYISACAAALTYTDVSSSSDLATQYAFLSTKLDYDKSISHQDFSVDVPGYGSLDYGEANNRVRQLSQQLGVNYDVKQAQGYIARYVSTDSDTAFSQCVKNVLAQNKAVQIEITGSGADFINICIHIGTEPTANGPLELILLSNGEFSHGVARKWTIAGGEPTVVVSWKNLAHKLEVSAIIMNGGHQVDSDDIVIPPAAQTVVVTSIDELTSETSTAHCGGKHGGISAGTGNVVELKADLNQTLDVDNIVAEKMAEQDGKPGFTLAPGAQADMHLIGKPTAQDILAQAWCAIYANENYSWSGRIHVQATNAKIIVSRPIDNGQDTRTETQAPSLD